VQTPIVVALGLTLALLTALFGFGLTRDPNAKASAVVGKLAPAFALRTIDGSRMVSLADLRGQVVVMNFWASWCAECKVEESALKAAWDRYRDQGVVMVGVSFEDAASAASGYAEEEGSDWPLLSDPGSAVALLYGVTGPPETFIIDRQGRVVFHKASPVSYADLTDHIEPLLLSGAR
jgi:cytochrome c biogenesis protein CcmG, thiol:disulfide interchange protein DsbE